MAILFIAAALTFSHNNRPTRPTQYTLLLRVVRFRRTGIGFAGNGTGDLFSTSKYGNIRLGEGKPEYSTLSGCLCLFVPV